MPSADWVAVVVVCVVVVVVGDCGRGVHVEWLDYVAETSAEWLDVVLFFFSPFGTTVLKPDLQIKKGEY